MSWRVVRGCARELQSPSRREGSRALAAAEPGSLCSDRWSQEDMLTLLECMKNNLPSNDGSKFKTTESHLDWEKVAFKDFSGEMCKMKWMEISNEVTDSCMGIKGVCLGGTVCSGDLLGLFELLQLRAPSPRPFTPTPSRIASPREALGRVVCVAALPDPVGLWRAKCGLVLSRDLPCPLPAAPSHLWPLVTCR